MQAEEARAEAHNMATPSATFRFPSPGFTVILDRCKPGLWDSGTLRLWNQKQDMIIEERSFGISAEGREAGRHAFLITSFFGTPCTSLVMAFGKRDPGK